MFDVRAMADHIGLSLPVSWQRCAEAAAETYVPGWLEQFDFDEILDFYGLDEPFCRRFYEELALIRADGMLQQACWLMRHILLEAPAEDYYDVWNWERVRWTHGSPMVPAVVLLTGLPVHLRYAALRGIPQQELDRQRKALGRTCMSERDKFLVDGIRFSRMIWNSLHIKGTLVPMGGLQFELDEKRYPAMDAVLPHRPPAVHIHIGAGIDFSPGAVDALLDRARRELPGIFPELSGRPFVFFTESWLLSPQLSGLLPPGSNIRRFQDRFTLLETHSAPADWLNFLYGIADPAFPPERLQEDTSLQRKVKAMLLQGQDLLSGLGVILP